MILEISEMITLLETHFEPQWGSQKVLTVGGVVGTSLFKHAIHACMKYVDFGNILVVDGCQDYIGLLREPLHNYLYYLNLFRSVSIPTIDQIQKPFYEFILEPRPGYQMIVDTSRFKGFKAMIVNNAHLIPKEYLNAMCDTICGKVLLIVDPLDMYGEPYGRMIHTLYDSLTKQSTLHALARSMYQIETRAIDRKVKGDFKAVKINKRSIGKIDTNQYVTNSEDILNTVREKQLRSQLRKNQKFIVAHKHVEYLYDQNSTPWAIGPNTMLSVTNITKPMTKLRIHSSASNVFSNITYIDSQRALYVKPANIISLDEAVHHRFQNVVLILGDEPMSSRMWYSLMKITNTLLVARY